MNIRYTGKFIEQYNKAYDIKKSLCESHPEIKEEIESIINNKGDVSEEISKIKKYFMNKLPDDIDIIESKEKYIQDVINSIYDFISIKHSFNKNKGVWLEYLFKYVFENTNKFKQLPNITWESNKIFKHFLLKDIKFNNKKYSKFATLPIERFEEIYNLKLCFNSFDPGKINKIITTFFENNESFKSNSINNIIFESNFIGAEIQYNCKINFYQIKDKELLIKLLFKLGIFAKSIDISKLRTDLTYLDNSSQKINILECKNYEHTPLSLNEIYKTIAYGIREKTFRGSKFNSLSLVTTGNISNDLSKRIKLININLNDVHKFTIDVMPVSLFLDNIKEKYFDDENKHKYHKKDINCWDFDTIKVEKNNRSSNQTGKYMYFTELNNRGDNDILIDANFLFVKPKKQKKQTNEKQLDEKTDLSEMGATFLQEDDK